MSGIASPTAVRDLMQRHNLYTRKGLGQNFLLDQNILSMIAESARLQTDEYVVEIGPGLGALTRELAIRSRGVLAIEIDQRLEPVLDETLAGFTNVEIVLQDILKTDIEKEIKQAFNLPEVPFYKVCANIPYNITSPIIFKLLEDCPHMHSAVLMMQKEVANRIMASPGNKEYGRLTVSTGYHAIVEHVLNVSHNCFYPRPEVDSVVLRFTPRQNPGDLIKEVKTLKALLNSAFQQRRKTILNICSGFFGMNKEETTQKLQALGLSPNLRPENLSREDFIALVKAFNQRQ